MIKVAFLASGHKLSLHCRFLLSYERYSRQLEPGTAEQELKLDPDQADLQQDTEAENTNGTNGKATAQSVLVKLRFASSNLFYFGQIQSE